MILADVQRALDAEIVCGWEWLGREVRSACGADLLSKVLAFTKEHTILLTSLTNVQVIRTAEVSDLSAIIFIRGKRPGLEVIRLAQSKGIPLLITWRHMYEACGILYSLGLEGCLPEEEAR